MEGTVYPHMQRFAFTGPGVHRKKIGVQRKELALAMDKPDSLLAVLAWRAPPGIGLGSLRNILDDRKLQQGLCKFHPTTLDLNLDILND